jgi:hypothetical protein
MSNLGIGAMLHYLGGGSPKSASDYYGRTIVDAKVNENALIMKFDDGVTVRLWDNGQSCCESRYITCDDDAKNLIGGKLVKIEVSEGGNIPCEYGAHETCFVEVATDKAHIKLCTHNEHNGYYGGFGLSIDETTI